MARSSGRSGRSFGNYRGGGTYSGNSILLGALAFAYLLFVRNKKQMKG